MPVELPIPIYVDDRDLCGRCPACVYEAEILETDEEPVHQVLGYPRPIQHDIRGIATHPNGSWVSLLQLDSDPRLGTMFGDQGKLHFSIRIDDLLIRRFDRVGLSLQCY